MDLHLEHREEANEIQERISRIYREQIIPRLSRICNRLTQNGEHLMLNKVEIDIGTIAEDELEKQLPQLLVQQFEEQVRQHIFSSLVHSDTSKALSRDQEEQDEKTGRTRTEVLVHYFRYGSLPWWNPFEEADIDSWINQEIGDDNDLFWTAIEKHVHKPAVRKRVIRHLNDEQLNDWIVTEDVWSFYEILQKSIIVEESLNISRKNLRQVFFDEFLGHLGRRNRSGIDRLKLAIEQKKLIVSHIFRRLNEEYAVPWDYFQKLREKLTPGLSLFTAEEWKRVIKKDEDYIDFEFEGEDRTIDKSESKELVEEEQFIEVTNAGIVLLWPYLENLFGHLGLIKNDQFVGDEAIGKAVHLLHFIATGMEEGSEHQWPLNKLLCGFSPDTFVSEELELTSTEKQEALAMMEAAIGHWEALKNTSASGFRETFLQRDGIITPDPNGWKVQIDRVVYDILLDRLPWPISIITLPWSDNIIYVQW